MSQMTQSRERVTVPAHERGAPLTFTQAEKIGLAVATVAVMVISGNFSFQIWLVVAAAVMAVLLLWRWESGRTYRILFYQIPVGFMIWNRKGIVYPRKRLRRPVIPLSTDAIESKGGELGLWHNHRSRRDTFVAVGDGSGMETLDLPAQVNALTRAASFIKRTANNAQFDIGLSFVFRRRPYDAYEVSQGMLESLNPNVYLPPKVIDQDNPTPTERRYRFLNAVAGDSMRITGQYGGTITMATVVTVERIGNLGANKGKTKLANDTIAKQPALRLARNVAGDLSRLCGVKNVKMLDQAGLSRFVRETYNVTQLDGYRSLYHSGTVKELALLGDKPLPADLPKSVSNALEHYGRTPHYPTTSIRVEPQRCYIDEAPHVTIKVTSQPEEIRPDFWNELLNLRYADDNRPIWLSVTYCGERVNVKSELQVLRRMIPIARTMQDAVMSRHYRDDPANRERDRRMSERRDQLYADGKYQQAFTILIGIDDEDDDKMDEALGLVLNCMDHMGVTGKVLRGRERQLPGLWSCAGVPMM